VDLRALSGSGRDDGSHSPGVCTLSPTSPWLVVQADTSRGEDVRAMRPHSPPQCPPALAALPARLPTEQSPAAETIPASAGSTDWEGTAGERGEEKPFRTGSAWASQRGCSRAQPCALGAGKQALAAARQRGPAWWQRRAAWLHGPCFWLLHSPRK